MPSIGARLAWTAAAASLVVIAGVSPAAAAPADGAGTAAVAGATCQRHDLPTLGFGASVLTGGDPSGRYQFGTESRLVDRDGVLVSEQESELWIDGQVHVFPTDALQPATQVDMVDANARGQIVGDRWTDNTTFHQDAWLYRNGRFTILPPLTPGASTYAIGINERGDVVGNTTTAAGLWHAVVWSASNPTSIREVVVPGHPEIETAAVGIDEDGTVVGHINTFPPEISYVWPARGTPYELTEPAGSSERHVVAIRNGLVVGDVLLGNDYIGWIWDLRTHRGHATSTQYVRTLSVNRWGTVGAANAIIHRNGRVVPLATEDMPLVVTDRGPAAGMAGGLYFGTPAIWTGC